MKKKIMLSILFAFLLLISFAQSARPCKDGNGLYYANVENTYVDQCGYTKIFDCDKWINAENCNVKVYIKINPGNVDFLFKSENYDNYTIFLYDMFGRKLMEKNVKGQAEFNKESLTNGLYLIKITDGTQVYTKRINI